METEPIQPTHEGACEPPVRRPVGVMIVALALAFALSGLSAYAFFDMTAFGERGAHAAEAAQAVRTRIVRDTFADISLTAKSAVVVDATTGVELYARNADAQLPLASLAKVPLVLAVSQVLPPDSIVTVPREIPATGNTGALPAGSGWRMRDIADFTLVGSSNGGAELLARVADEPLRARFPQAPEGRAAVWVMNDIARRYGGADMYFLNASGLDTSGTQSGAYGTARAVAALFAYAASTSPDAFTATTRKEVEIKSQSGRVAVASNTDDALDAIPGLVMGKTGYTELAGGNLAVVFDVSGRRIVAVVLGSTKDGRFADMRAIAHAARAAFPAP